MRRRLLFRHIPPPPPDPVFPDEYTVKIIFQNHTSNLVQVSYYCDKETPSVTTNDFPIFPSIAQTGGIPFGEDFTLTYKAPATNKVVFMIKDAKFDNNNFHYQGDEVEIDYKGFNSSHSTDYCVFEVTILEDNPNENILIGVEIISKS